MPVGAANVSQRQKAVALAIALVAIAVVVLVVALIGGDDSRGGKRRGPPFNAAAFARAARVETPPLKPGAVLRDRREAAGPVAADGRYLLAVIGPVEAEEATPRLVQRDLR